MELPEVEEGTVSFETAPIANGTASGSPGFRSRRRLFVVALLVVAGSTLVGATR